jgi:site-specific recombinase XerD
VAATLERYRQYLLHERRLATTTARLYVYRVRPFVSATLSPNGLTQDWATLRAADVIDFVVARTPQQSRGTAKLTVTALRSLLGFLHVEGHIAESLTGGVPSVARWRLAGLPQGLSPRDLRALLASCDRRTVTGRRDFAVLTILVRLGLRAREVATLRLDDIRWRTGTIVVRGKGHHIEELPLPNDVGDAVVAYVRRGRPVTAMDRTVFVRVKAPHRPLTASGVTGIVSAAANRAGLGRIHAHRLRHTAAMCLLRAGANLLQPQRRQCRAAKDAARCDFRAVFCRSEWVEFGTDFLSGGPRYILGKRQAVLHSRGDRLVNVGQRHQHANRLLHAHQPR